MAHAARHLDAGGGVTDIGHLDGRAGDFVQLPEPDLQVVDTGGQPRTQVPQSLAAAAHAHVIGIGQARGARQDDPHPGVVGIGGPEVLRVGVRFAQRVDRQRIAERGVAEQQFRILGFLDRVVGAAQDVAVAINQLQDRVQRVRGPVDVQPDLGAGDGLERVHIQIAGPVQCAPDFQAQPAIVVSRLFVRRQLAQVLGCGGCLIGARHRGVACLPLHRDVRVSVVRVFQQLQATPISRSRRRAHLDIGEAAQLQEHRRIQGEVRHIGNGQFNGVRPRPDAQRLGGKDFGESVEAEQIQELPVVEQAVVVVVLRILGVDPQGVSAVDRVDRDRRRRARNEGDIAAVNEEGEHVVEDRVGKLVVLLGGKDEIEVQILAGPRVQLEIELQVRGVLRAQQEPPAVKPNSVSKSASPCREAKPVQKSFTFGPAASATSPLDRMIPESIPIDANPLRKIPAEVSPLTRIALPTGVTPGPNSVSRRRSASVVVCSISNGPKPPAPGRSATPQTPSLVSTCEPPAGVKPAPAVQSFSEVSTTGCPGCPSTYSEPPMRSVMSSGRPVAVNPALPPSSLTTRLWSALLSSRRPPDVWKSGT